MTNNASHNMAVAEKMSVKEILNDYKENYNKVRKLLDEDSKNDPETEPYLSKYKAKEVLCNMYQSLKTFADFGTAVDTIKLDAMLGVVLLNIGIIHLETEELTASENVLLEAKDTVFPNGLKPENVIPLLNIYNNLGILWSNRDMPDKAKTYLLQAKDTYENFKCTLQMPLPIERIINSTDADISEDFMVLEKAHTLTLFFLAQVYGSLKESLKSAVYCHVTLRRQLQYNDYEPIEWSLNSATLSQFFAELNGFSQARHHLAAASAIMRQYEATLPKEDNSEASLAKLENYRHRSADVARCWIKYCVMLMMASKNRLMNDEETLTEAITDMSNLTLEDNENICEGDIKNLVFPVLDVSYFEETVTDKFILTYEEARKVFMACQAWLRKAEQYYKLETLASDYVELVQDSSSAYSYLAFFEEDDERRAKMQKRRITMLEELLKEINPLYYLQYCRQLWYELGEIYCEILNIKLDKLNNTNEKPTAQALIKINSLCENSIENYDRFLNSVKDKNGVMPSKLDHDVIKPVLTAYVYIGRNSMKRIAVDKEVQLNHVKKSLESYKAVVDICAKDKGAAEMMPEELSLCQEMVNILPLKIKKLQTEMVTG